MRKKAVREKKEDKEDMPEKEKTAAVVTEESKENEKEAEHSSEKPVEEASITPAETIPAAPSDAETVIADPVAEIIKKVEELTVENKKNEELEKMEATGVFTKEGLTNVFHLDEIFNVKLIPV